LDFGLIVTQAVNAVGGKRQKGQQCGQHQQQQPHPDAYTGQPKIFKTHP
jgi:hypothetical protein